jgi:MarR-like DNA-binding transcriptional regulator SgrR of sgrS sRNA
MKGINLAQNNGMWKGSRAGLDALHFWVIKRLKKPKNCPSCNKKKKLDLANISQKYRRSLNDWEWLCRYCHMKKDGRLIKLIQRNKSRTLKKKRCASCGQWFKPWRSKGRCCSRSCSAYLANKKRWNYDRRK